MKFGELDVQASNRKLLCIKRDLFYYCMYSERNFRCYKSMVCLLLVRLHSNSVHLHAVGITEIEIRPTRIFSSNSTE